MSITINGTTGIAGVDGSAATPSVQGGDSNTGVFFPAADTVAVTTGGTERMRIDSSGNVGIGTTSTYGFKMFVLGSANSGVAVSDNTNTVYMMGDGGTTVMVGTSNTVPLRFNTSATERMRIDSNGKVLVGRTTAYNDGSIGTPVFQSTSSTGAFAGGAFISSSTSATTQIGFVNPNGTVGTISSTGTATAYTTSSDYRLKENVQPMVGALDTIAQLNPVTYNWKVDGSDGQGFIAHELQAVVPDCVSGEKDAVDDEGRPRYQGVDTSFLVATLVSAIQELTARIAALEAK
jgi:predicted RNA-binding protein with TRAM domain